MSKKRPVELESFRPRGHGSKFSRKKEAAVAALLSQRNVEEAAKTAGIGTQTLYRWLKLPDFQAAYLEARRATVAQSNARLQQYSSAAVSTLFKVMLDPSAPASTRVRAADSVLDHAKQSIDQEDIEVRVAALEQAAITAEAKRKQQEELNAKYPATPL